MPSLFSNDKCSFKEQLDNLKDPCFQRRIIALLFDQACDVLKAFDGDFRLFLILCLVGRATLQARAGLSDNGSRAQDGRAEGLNASDIAFASGIPRETVRRKLADLARRGWLVCDGQGMWRLAPDDDSRATGLNGARARRELCGLENRTVGRLVDLVSALRDAVDSAGADGVGAPAPPPERTKSIERRRPRH